MPGWKHSSVVEFTDSEPTNILSAEPTNDVESDPSIESKSFDKPVTESEPTIESSLESESRINDCNNSRKTMNEGC